MNIKKFCTDRILERSDICNLVALSKTMIHGLNHGKNYIFYGRRNTGKTSLVRSVLLPELKKQNKGLICVFVDLMSVQSLDDISHRLASAISESISKEFPTQSMLKKFLSSLMALKPEISVDSQTGETSVSLTTTKRGAPAIKLVFDELIRLHKKYGVVLAIDEFQDIATVKTAEAVLRSVFQELPNNFPIIILGSKKHLLSKIFANPAAPLANWGHDIEMPTISNEEYAVYINERFSRFNLKISVAETAFLQELMRYIPEAINLVCISVIDFYSDEKIVNKEIIVRAINQLLDTRRSRFEEFLSHFSEKEIFFLKALAINEPVNSLTGMEFLRTSTLSSAGALKIKKKLEDDAVIYRSLDGYFISDPLLGRYLLKYR